MIIQGVILGTTFLCHISVVFMMTLSLILVFLLTIQSSTQNFIALSTDGKILSWLLNLNLTFEVLRIGVGSCLLLLVHWKLELFHSDNSGAIVVKMNAFVLNEELSFKKLGFFISSNVDWAFCIVTITKTASTKMWVLIRFVFCSAEFWFGTVALYLFRYTTQFCMENCCHFWTGAPNC